MARVLLECGNALVRLDRVEALQEAGHDVSACAGPRSDDCPVLHGHTCEAVANADVVISCLGDQTLRVSLANRLVHPEQPVVAVLTGPSVEQVHSDVDGLEIITSGVDDEALAATVTAVVERLDRGSTP